MLLLNLGCGSTRPVDERWVNLDDLHWQLPEGSPERSALDAESNYVQHDVSSGALPFPDGYFDGVLASHFFEHFDAQEGLRIMKECRRVLKAGSPLLVSVPDATYFRRVYHEDTNENWPRLFGVTDPKNTIPTFFEAALWFEQHKVILTEDALWAYFVRAGFHEPSRWIGVEPTESLVEMSKQLNRPEFSLTMYSLA